MFAFEKAVVRFFDRHGVEAHWHPGRHLLTSSRVNIQFVPVCATGLPEAGEVVEAAGFTIRLWEDVWHTHSRVVENRLLSVLGLNKRVHARTTKVVPLSAADYREFLAAYHLNVPTGSRYRYGLEEGGELLAVAGFGRSCPVQYGGRTYRSHEMIRYAAREGITVVGGLSKLISHFVRQQQPGHLMTYVDKEWSQGRSYLRLGFEVAGESPPQIFWIDPQACQRHYPARDGRARPAGWYEVRNLGNLKLVKVWDNVP